MSFDFDAFNRPVVEEFRANAGRVGGPFEGFNVLLLTTIGAKSGQPRLVPLVYAEDGDRLLIFASKAGSPTHPDWYHNLKKNPRVTVEVGTEKYEANAVELTGAERDRHFKAMAERHPNFAEYQEKTTRLIPVVALERV